MAARENEKYLARYAEPVARLVATAMPAAAQRSTCALVVPVRAESGAFLRGYDEALQQVAREGGRALVVVVVNGRGGGPEEAANRRTLRELRCWGARRWSSACGQVELHEGELYDLLLVSSCSGSHAFGEKEGVGLARKQGFDVAFALGERGDVSGRAIFSCDADASLPPDYFAAGTRAFSTVVDSSARPVAAVLPFIHEPGVDLGIHAATEAYELWFRYYVAGLIWAGSPYAFPALGSTMVIDREAYAVVRGFSRRLAGEDYYTLDKLAKVGSLVLPLTAPIRLLSRRSERAPFGTGPAVSRIIERGEESLPFYPAGCFDGLATVLRLLVDYSQTGGLAELRRRVEQRGRGISEALESLGAWSAFADAPRQAPCGQQLLFRLLVWFDGLRTLRFVNYLRAHHFDAYDRNRALLTAPFVPEGLAAEELSVQLAWFRVAGLPRTTGVMQTILGRLSRSG